eukprot:1645664-Amphidinium_carterae.2
MNGTRAASQAWGTHVTNVMLELGGSEGTLQWLDSCVSVRFVGFDFKCIARIGPGTQNHGDILKRVVSKNADGFAWAADENHVQTVLVKMGLVDKRSKGGEITGSRITGGGLPNGADSLESDRVASYRSVAGTLLCLSVDRLDIQFACSMVMVGVRIA